MKIETNDKGTFVLKDVFLGILLVTEGGDTISICMRDDGFELNYGGMWYEAKGGELGELGCVDLRKIVGVAYLSTNRDVSCFNNLAKRIPELEGPLTDELLKAIALRSDSDTYLDGFDLDSSNKFFGYLSNKNNYANAKAIEGDVSNEPSRRDEPQGNQGGDWLSVCKKNASDT